MKRVSDRDVLHGPGAIDERPDLAAGLVRDVGQLAREFLGDEAVSRNAALVELLEPTDLIRLEAVGLTV